MAKKKPAKKAKKSVKKKSKNLFGTIAIFFTIFVLVGILTFGTIYGVNRAFFTVGESDQGNSDIPIEPEPEPIPEPEPEPEEVISRVDFQPVIDSWVKTIGGNKSVLVYDLDLDERVGEYNAKENYNTASLYKLFVVYEGYKRISDGEWDGNVKAGSTGRTISKCLDLAIRESNSSCAETLWGIIGRDNLNNIIENEWGITNSNIPKLISNVGDIMLIMKRFDEHPDFNDPALLEIMWDSFINQPKTEYNWRQGLPSGFKQAKVYNKVGWDWNGKSWNIYHDAAIVEFPETERNLIVVVMTNQVPYQRITELGNKIETSVYSQAG